MFVLECGQKLQVRHVMKWNKGVRDIRAPIEKGQLKEGIGDNGGSCPDRLSFEVRERSGSHKKKERGIGTQVQ